MIHFLQCGILKYLCIATTIVRILLKLIENIIYKILTIIINFINCTRKIVCESRPGPGNTHTHERRVAHTVLEYYEREKVMDYN